MNSVPSISRNQNNHPANISADMLRTRLISLFTVSADELNSAILSERDFFENAIGDVRDWISRDPHRVNGFLERFDRAMASVGHRFGSPHMIERVREVVRTQRDRVLIERDPADQSALGEIAEHVSWFADRLAMSPVSKKDFFVNSALFFFGDHGQFLHDQGLLKRQHRAELHRFKKFEGSFARFAQKARWRGVAERSSVRHYALPR